MTEQVPHDRAPHYDTLIIGAGMSGLAAGIRLAQFDQRVAILERHYLWGGLNSYYKLAGRRFDVGLHALTNYVPKGTRGRPLTRVLRQLRIPYDSLELGQQHGSRVVFADNQLRFSNQLDLLREEVRREFPGQAPRFDALADEIGAMPFDVPDDGRGAHAFLAERLDDRRLIDMLLLPILFYGSPTPNDLELPSFIVLWKSLYEEGFARPRGGIRPLLDSLRRKFLDLGGELRMRSGVSRVLHEDGRLQGVLLDDGSELMADRVISSAGHVETMRLCGPSVPRQDERREAGRMTFVESTTLLDQRAPDLDLSDTIVFFNLDDELVYREPQELVSLSSGVVCCPENYAGQDPTDEGVLRLTLMANADHWQELDEEGYVQAKERTWERGFDSIAEFMPDVRTHVVTKDIFTPRTITRFTGHINGAVYGAPDKCRSGETPIAGLYLCGTDQGYLGIVGAMLSGVAMANKHALIPA